MCNKCTCKYIYTYMHIHIYSASHMKNPMQQHGHFSNHQLYKPNVVHYTFGVQGVCAISVCGRD